jgi:hypothetical protein
MVNDIHHRVRRDRADKAGRITLRHGGRHYSIDIGRTHVARRPDPYIAAELAEYGMLADDEPLWAAVGASSGGTGYPLSRPERPSPMYAKCPPCVLSPRMTHV